jgi:hypothetical protein
MVCGTLPSGGLRISPLIEYFFFTFVFVESVYPRAGGSCPNSRLSRQATDQMFLKVFVLKINFFMKYFIKCDSGAGMRQKEE